MKQDKTEPGNGLRSLIDELGARAGRLASVEGIAAGFPARVQAVGPATTTNVPLADGPSAVMLALPPITLPVGSKINISGYATLTNTVAAIRNANIAVELSPGGGGDIGALQKTTLAASENDRAVPFNNDYVTTTATTNLVITVWDTTGGAAPGDLTVQGNNVVAVAVRVG